MGLKKLQNLKFLKIFLVQLILLEVLVDWTTAGDLLTDNLISNSDQNQNSRNFQNSQTNDENENSVSSRRTFGTSSENFVTISSPPIMSQKTDQSGQEMFISQDFSDFSESQFNSNITGTGSIDNLENLENTDFEVNSTDFSDQPPIIQFSLEFQILIYILYNTVFVAAVLGNLLVCYVVFASKRMRTVTNYLIANLAMGDLLMALLCVPFSYIPILFQYWPFGALLCHLVSPAQAVCVFVSAYTLVVLASDRYVAILYPLKPRMRRSQALIVIGLVWLVAIFTAIPIMVTTVHFVNTNSNSSLPYCEEEWSNDFERVAYSLSLMVLQYFFPLIVLIFTYTRIALAIWWKKPPGEAEDHRDQRLAKAKRKTVVQSLAVVAGYTLAWAPLNVLLLFFSLFPALAKARYTIFIFFTFHWLAMAHTAYNFFIYAWLNVSFRQNFKSALAKLHCPFLSPCCTQLAISTQSNGKNYNGPKSSVSGHAKVECHPPAKNSKNSMKYTTTVQKPDLQITTSTNPDSPPDIVTSSPTKGNNNFQRNCNSIDDLDQNIDMDGPIWT